MGNFILNKQKKSCPSTTLTTQDTGIPPPTDTQAIMTGDQTTPLLLLQDTQQPGTTHSPPDIAAHWSHHTAILDITHTADTDIPQHMPEAAHGPTHPDTIQAIHH